MSSLVFDEIRRPARALPMLVLLLSSAWLGLGGCIERDEFHCTQSPQCIDIDGETQGVCQPSGYCSFPDPRCPYAKQRYGEYTPTWLSRKCVNPENIGIVDDEMTGTGETGMTDTGSSDSGGPSTTSSGTGSSSGESGTATGMGTTTSGGSQTSTTG